MYRVLSAKVRKVSVHRPHLAGVVDCREGARSLMLVRPVGG